MSVVTHYTGRFMRLLPVLLFCVSFSSQAGIYQWQDADGNKHFSDRPNPEAKILDVKPGYGYYRIAKVYDGDTVLLSDGRKIRLLGINTPEVSHKDKKADAGGNEAKQWLISKLESNKVRLVTDVEKTDKYGRILAHLFTETKEHINLQLVEAGLAEVTIYPPNLLYAEQLIKAQDKAELEKRGIWRSKDYAVKPVSSLEENGHSGWTRLEGQVKRIRPSRKFIYLEFSEVFEVRIERQWLSLFPELKSYLNKTVEARGWINSNKGRFSMLVRHPSALKIK